MRELRYIEVDDGAEDPQPARRRVHQSPLRGPGFDFDEHQPYRPGDDVRRIDWNVTARMDAPFVRHTHAEREMNVMIAMDVSRSMALGTSRLLEERGADVHHRRRCCSPRCRTRSTPAFWRSRDRVRRYRARRGARARRRGRCSQQCWAAGRRRGRPRCCRWCAHLREDAAAHEHRVPRVGLHDRRGSVRQPRSGDAGRATRRDWRRARRPARAQLPAGRGFLTMRDLESGHKVAVGSDGAYPPAVCRRRSPAPRSADAVRSIASRWITCSCRQTRARSSRCCRCLRRGCDRESRNQMDRGGARRGCRGFERGRRPNRTSRRSVHLDRTAMWVADHVRYTDRDHLPARHGRRRRRSRQRQAEARRARGGRHRHEPADAVGRRHAVPFRLRPDDLSRRPAVALNRADDRALLRPAVRSASGRCAAGGGSAGAGRGDRVQKRAARRSALLPIPRPAYDREAAGNAVGRFSRSAWGSILASIVPAGLVAAAVAARARTATSRRSRAPGAVGGARVA